MCGRQAMLDGTQDDTPQYNKHPSAEYPPGWQSRRRKVPRRDGFICQECGVRSTRVDDVRFDVDHILPKSDGGSHAPENLQTLCLSCHANKHPGNQGLRQRARTYERRVRRSWSESFSRHSGQSMERQTKTRRCSTVTAVVFGYAR
jgi:5-methylcytosine-specific restriction endonuclease McrA